MSTSMRRRCSMAARGTPAGTRGVVAFACGHPVLLQAAVQHGYTSPMWLSAHDLETWLAPATTLKPGATATVVPRAWPSAFINADHVNGVPPLDETVTVPHSIKTGLRLGVDFAGPAARHAEAHGLRSKWWITKVQLDRDHSMTLRKGAPPPLVVTWQSSDPMYCVSQLASPAAAEGAFWYGGTGSAVGDRTVAADLAKHAEHHGFSSHVYFPASHAERLGLKTRRGAQPCALRPAGWDRPDIYNVSELQSCAALLAERTAPLPADDAPPTMLFTGAPLQGRQLQWARAHGPWPHALFVTKSEMIERRLWARASARTLWAAPLFNAEQFDAPIEEVCALVGKLPQGAKAVPS